MQLELLSRQELKSIPSASGIEIIDNSIYAIGDNSPFLFILDKNFDVKDKWPIASLANVKDGIIPNASKPDYEAMASAVIGNEKVLLVVGSGSKSPDRDSLVIIHLETKRTENYSIKTFYEAVKSSAKLSDEELNIEAAAVSGNTLYLFNRGKNIVIECALNELLNHLLRWEKCPLPKVYRIKLPSSDKLQAGFSGAAFVEGGNKMVFTASVENTANWIDDGEIVGSYIGIINLKELKNNYSPACIPIKDNERVLNIKAESVALTANTTTTLELLLVTDSDGGASEIMKVKLTL